MHEFLYVAEQAARMAGLILQDWRKKFTVATKSGPSDLVTEADLASQKAIHQLIAARFPDHGFLGEEGLNFAGSSPYRWIIDPLDGTANYVHGNPYYAVSIGLERNGELLVGVVYDPSFDQLFSAVKGEGTRLNGVPVRVSQVLSLSSALVVASFPHNARAESPALSRFLKVLPRAQSVQRTGSAAINLAYTAAGRYDGFWSSSLKSWDMAAGVLLVTEAGGKVTRMNGSLFDLHYPDLLATNGTPLHDEMGQVLSSP